MSNAASLLALSRRPPLALVLAPLLALVPSCGDDDGPGMDADGGMADMDLPADAGPPDLATVRPCERDEDCADRVECTRDSCDPRGFCRNVVDLAVCDDGVFCNGVEQCDPVRGCIPGPPESCNDDDVCTIDRCSEETKSCTYRPRDFDDDGEADWHCEGGTDCDDRDPARGSRSAELCDDGVDNDCDGEVDELDCGGPPYDTCLEPLDVSAGGRFVVSTVGAAPDYVLPCAGSGYRDVVLRFTITGGPRDVAITADGAEGLAAIGLRDACGTPAPPLACATGFPATIRRRALRPGTYFVVVGSAPWTSTGGDEVDVDVAFTDPTPPPANETCATAAPLELSPTAVVSTSLVEVRDDLMLPCSFARHADLVWSFTLEERSDVAINATATGRETLYGAVYGEPCGAASSIVRCTAGAPLATRLRDLPAGTYYLALEAPEDRSADLNLTVTRSPPTATPAGETCAEPIPLPLGTTVTGTLADKEDDVVTSCGFNYVDAVYSFTLAEPQDVRFTVDGAGRYVNASLRRACADGATQLRCDAGVPARGVVRALAAGTYFLVVEGPTRAGFTVRVDASAPTTPTMVRGNEICEGAYVVPATGGLFSGTTTTALDDYRATLCATTAAGPDVAFQLDLTARKRVVASTIGSTFDTVLILYRGSCVPANETACDDDGGGASTSRIERTLDPGTWFFVVDGFAAGRSGDYLFEVLVTDP